MLIAKTILPVSFEGIEVEEGVLVIVDQFHPHVESLLSDGKLVADDESQPFKDYNLCTEASYQGLWFRSVVEPDEQATPSDVPQIGCLV